MNQTTQKSTNILLLRNVGIVIAVTIVCFLIGGGWHLICNPHDINGYFHSCYADEEKIGACILLFIGGGGLAATLGATITITVLVIKRLRA
jgi:hypothetical protein